VLVRSQAWATASWIGDSNQSFYRAIESFSLLINRSVQLMAKAAIDGGFSPGGASLKHPMVDNAARVVDLEASGILA
jgi:hypothetical protein